MLKKILRNFIVVLIKKGIDIYAKQEEQKDDYVNLFKHYVNHGVIKSHDFSFNQFRSEVLNYKKQLLIGTYDYKFSKSVSSSSLYNTVYSILLDALFKVDLQSQRDELVSYLNSFQDECGYFFDDKLLESCYKDCDWFGIKHLLTHIIICYKYLDATPRYQFNFLIKYYDEEYLRKFLGSINFDIANDDDNKICNLAIALQYQRDYFHDEKAQVALDRIYSFLEKRINLQTGSWGNIDVSDRYELSRVQQIAYHLFVFWLYDKRKVPNVEKLIDLCLENQNEFGGYNANLIGSACTDIDCIFLLNKLSKITTYRREDVIFSLRKAFPWVMTNQNLDGGFVFKRNEDFEYGEAALFSKKNVSNMFATWFRALSVSYICDALDIDNSFNHIDCPGYQY